MSDITTRTVGPEKIGDSADKTIEELIEEEGEVESRLQLVESLDMPGDEEQAMRDDPELYEQELAYTELPDGEATEAAPAITAGYFTSEPYIGFTAYLRTGTIDTLLSIDEATEIVATLSEQLAKAADDLGS